jgi:2-haloalkanoic acid dehalogenase type II
VTIEVITFDLDNTLWDVEPALLRAEEAQRHWLLTHRPGAMEAVDHEALWQLKKALWASHPELTHNVSAMRKLLLYELQVRAGYSDDDAQHGADAAFAAFLAERQQVELYAEALQVLQTLAQHYRLGALTNGNADVYRTDAGEYFDFAFLAEDIGASKPAPDMFHAALEKTGASPSGVVHVGDNPRHDIDGAKAVGFRAVWINADDTPWGGNTAPDAIIRHIGELPEVIAALTGG